MSAATSSSRSDRVARGQFYTPACLADLTLAITAGDRLDGARILDPTCGDGVFLAAARRRGVPATQLVGCDRDPEAIAQAQARVPGAQCVLGDLFASDLGRFDVIVGNPPYVRRHRWSKTDHAIIAARLATLGDGELSGFATELTASGDLSACIFALAAGLLKEGGHLGFVVSAALLEADYSRALWSILASLGRVTDIVSAPRERWFSQAAVNTIIVVFERIGGGCSSTRSPVRLWQLTQLTSECAKRVGSRGQLAGVAEQRSVEGDKPRRWGQVLRAPRLWLELESQGAAWLRLGDVATIRRGLTSGANDIFYLTRALAKKRGIESECLRPLVRAPNKSLPASISISPESINDVVVFLNSAAPERYPGAYRYLESHSDAALRPSLIPRSPWWKLPTRQAQLFLTKAYAARFVQRLCSQHVECDQRVYSVVPKHSGDLELLAAVLNSSFSALAIEALGRGSMGQGALEWTVKDARELPIVDYRRLSDSAREELLRTFRVLAVRPIRNVYDEVLASDRGDLDRAVAQADPTLHAASRTIAIAVANACEQRHLRVKAVVPID